MVQLQQPPQNLLACLLADGETDAVVFWKEVDLVKSVAEVCPAKCIRHSVVYLYLQCSKADDVAVHTLRFAPVATRQLNRRVYAEANVVEDIVRPSVFHVGNQWSK